MDTQQIINQENADLINTNLIKSLELFGMQHMVSADGGYFILHTGLPDVFFNIICLPDIKTFDTKIVSKINEPFLKDNLPFSWLFEEGKITKEVENNFSTEIYLFGGDLTGLIYDVDSYILPQTINPLCKIELITDIQSLEKWVSVMATSFAYSKQAENLLLNNLSVYLGTSDKFIPIGAYVHGQLVATAALFIANNVGGFYYDSTLEAFRHQGICSTLYYYRLQLLKELGINKAVIQACPLATSIAKKIGFKQVTNYKLYYHGVKH